MTNKPFGVEELRIVGSAGTGLIESVADLHIRVGGGCTVGIGTSNLNIQDGTADVNNDSVLNAGIVTANSYYGNFKGTIDPVTSTVSIGTNIGDVFSVSSNTISGDDPGADRIIFWDHGEAELTHLSLGTGLEIDGTQLSANSDAGKTYTLAALDSHPNTTLRLSDTVTDDDVLITAGTNVSFADTTASGFTINVATGAGKTYTLEAVDAAPNATLRLSDTIVDDDVTITAGTNVSFAATSASGFTINVATGAGITFSAIDVKQYTDVPSPRTERSCTNPIVVNVDSDTATIGIGSTSNAYGNKFIQEDDPTTTDGGSWDVCDGDVWYDTSDSSAGTGGTIPVGGIIMFSGTETELNALTNWNLCDGTNGTPNLADKFVICGNNWENHDGTDKWVTRVETGSAPGTETGGSKNAVLASHTHTYSRRPQVTKKTYGDSDHARPSDSEQDATTTNTGIDNTGSVVTDGSVSVTNANLPPYFALAYIMRIS